MVYHPRLLLSPLAGSASAGKVRLVFGARQTGKSTLIRQLSGPGVAWINLQDRRQRLDFERQPAAFTQALQARSESRVRVLVDEIQKVPALLDEVQFLHDQEPGRFEFFLTGSSARRLKASTANLLPGRAHLHRLCPLVLPERSGSIAGRLLPLPVGPSFAPGFPLPALDDLLVFGSLPGIALEPGESRVRTLESYVELYLEEEIRREGLVRNLGAFQQFLELAALESGQTINFSAISKESGVPVATLRIFYQVLEDTFIGYRLPAYGERSRKRVLTTPRFLFFDLGVRNAAARLPLTAALVRTQAGSLFENWVGLELIHRCHYLGRTARVSGWRTAHGAEVDFVVETPSEAIPIEVKWTERPDESDARHLKLFLATYPRKARRGFVVCRCAEPRQITENIQAIPWQWL
ncbi:MAG TPA: ATP-binding protein [Verrucomicrobiota bacterium]|nr:ATP-binding protein [Verrucomicrobiota bacterium]HNU50791.1 ATP-binding protein [Verrucomicrobiota bacterium]